MSSILLALSLSSGISINDKIANANYKDEDRFKLNNLVANIKNFTNSKTADSKTDVSVSQNLFDAINTIYKHRKDNDPNSVLYKSMQKNMHIENKDLNLDIGKYKKYGPDALKAMAFMAEKFKGGHFTVWDGKTKDAINKLAKEVTEQINHCDSWFWALGGSQKDIDEYKKYVKKNGEYDKELQLSENGEDIEQIAKDVDRECGLVFEKSLLINIKRVLHVHSFKNKDKKIDAKRGEVIGKQAFYTQGFQHLCYAVFNKFVSDGDVEKIDEDMEAKIYYVYDKLFNRLKQYERAKDMENFYCGGGINKEFKNLCVSLRDNFVKNYQNLKLPDVFNLCNENFLASALLAGMSIFEKNLQIKILDEIVFKDLDSNNAIQKLVDESYKLAIYYAPKFERDGMIDFEGSDSGMFLFTKIQSTIILGSAS